MESQQAIFYKEKYLVIEEAVPKNICDIFVNYSKFQALYDFTPENGNDAQIKGTHSRYADFLMESILLYLQPLVEDKVGEKLYPTYSYYRVYKKNDKLEPHVDRNECEISATLALGWENSKPWPFKLSNDQIYINNTPECHSPDDKKGISVELQPGDLLIYKGPEVKHWREPLQDSYYTQAFFHYVRANGPHRSLKYDGRTTIGVPKISPLFEYVKYSDWTQALLKYIAIQNGEKHAINERT